MTKAIVCLVGQLCDNYVLSQVYSIDPFIDCMRHLFFFIVDSCKVLPSFTNIVGSCEAGYNLFNEDKRSFNPGWSSIYNSTLGSWTNYSASIRKAFLYNDSDHLDTYTYIGEHATYGAGGYIYEFRGRMSDMLTNVSALRESSWLDMQTRAVIIQLSLYNPNVNLFTFVTILAEFLPTGGLHPSARFEPVSLLNYYEGRTRRNLVE